MHVNEREIIKVFILYQEILILNLPLTITETEVILVLKKKKIHLWYYLLHVHSHEPKRTMHNNGITFGKALTDRTRM